MLYRKVRTVLVGLRARLTAPAHTPRSFEASLEAPRKAGRSAAGGSHPLFDSVTTMDIVLIENLGSCAMACR